MPVLTLLRGLVLVTTLLSQPILAERIVIGPYQAGLEQGAQIYRLDPQQSQLLLQTFKGGFLAAFGHNHVLALRDVQGLVLLANQAANSHADLLIPVDAIEIDNPALRQAAGKGFESRPSASDIIGTRHNMLSSGQLDAADFPNIRVHIALQRWQPPQALLRLTLTVRGQASELQVPAQVYIDDHALRLNATLELSQQALGITPFSALGGTLKVADTVKLSVSLRAYRLQAL